VNELVQSTDRQVAGLNIECFIWYSPKTNYLCHWVFKQLNKFKALHNNRNNRDLHKFHPPPYTTRLAPYDVYLFGSIKEVLRRAYLTSDDKVEVAASNFLKKSV